MPDRRRASRQCMARDGRIERPGSAIASACPHDGLKFWPTRGHGWNATACALRLWIAALIVATIEALSLLSPAHALDAIPVPENQDVIELTTRGTLYSDRGDELQIATAPGRDGVVGRISVRAKVQGTNPNWMVFALSNDSDTVIERWLTSNRYTLVGSGVIWPDLDARRLEAVTPSIGFIPERIKSDRADVFRLTLEPGQTVTFAVELASERLARVFLWKPLAYELKIRERQLLNGALLGVTGVLALFLTAIFGANHKLIFPSAALFAWSVLVYLCIDFGFFHRLFNLRPEDNAVYRSAAESAMAASLVIFLYIFLRLAYSHGIFRMLISVWMLAQLALVAVAVVDPRLAATFARLSFLLIGGLGALMILFLAIRGQDRALSLTAPWLLFLVWIFAAAMALTGRLAGDVVVTGLVGGLVVVVLMIGIMVTQFAFRTPGPVYGAMPGDHQLRALAVDGANAATWQWNVRRDEIKVSPAVEAALGLNGGELSSKVDDFIVHIHPGDRERFRMTLRSVKERGNTRIKIDFQLRHADNTYRWFELEASTVPSADGRNQRCVGLLRDVTEQHLTRERLLSDAVNCAITNLPNRELFIDRLQLAMRRAKSGDAPRPTVVYIGVDRFRAVNEALGLQTGDTLLKSLSRRLQHHLSEEDTLARMDGDGFAVLLLSEQDPRAIAQLAENLRQSIRAPIPIMTQKVVLTGSLGIAVYDGQTDAREFVREAAIAMYRAKRTGADKVEIFHADMREAPDDRTQREAELRRAIANDEIKVYYQPIIYLPTEELAGFEALARWQHPKRGLLPPAAFISLAEDTDLIADLGTRVLMRASATMKTWQHELPRSERPLFVSVNVSSRQLLDQDLVQNVKHILASGGLPEGALRLEITESHAMENPEQSVHLLEQLSAAGAEIALDDFGTGYSSLAYLQRFTFDSIKIDRGFLASDIGDGDGAGPAIVRSVVALAHELGKTVVAEGVEDPDEVAFLRAIGCEYAQGFYYGEPMSEADVVQLLRIVRRAERRLESQGLFRLKRKPKTEVTTDADEMKRLEAGSARKNGRGNGRRPAESDKAREPRRSIASIAAMNKRGAIEGLPESLVRPMQRITPAGRPLNEQLAGAGARPMPPPSSRPQPIPRPATQGNEPGASAMAQRNPAAPVTPSNPAQRTASPPQQPLQAPRQAQPAPSERAPQPTPPSPRPLASASPKPQGDTVRPPVAPLANGTSYGASTTQGQPRPPSQPRPMSTPPPASQPLTPPEPPRTPGTSGSNHGQRTPDGELPRPDPIRETATRDGARQEPARPHGYAAPQAAQSPQPPANPPKPSADLGLSKVSAASLNTGPPPQAGTSPPPSPPHTPPIVPGALPQLSNLPPGIAESLARLAGTSSRPGPTPESHRPEADEPSKRQGSGKG